ncbi:muconolactone Delta-isomerase family protein [Paraburkholderia sp. RL17-337-BIB-A]|uniref:muconolactone Delta-isomerase family protein n=1 Tax=Paraburkholderia sp. RL17-337-BIB-A TaxID=3031636 RepID=UPI0038BC2448
MPHDMPLAQADEIKAREKAYSQETQRQGKWQQLHRVVGQYANYGIVDVDSHDELHAMLSGLPLFPYMACATMARILFQFGTNVFFLIAFMIASLT